MTYASGQKTDHNLTILHDSPSRIGYYREILPWEKPSAHGLGDKVASEITWS